MIGVYALALIVVVAVGLVMGGFSLRRLRRVRAARTEGLRRRQELRPDEWFARYMPGLSVMRRKDLTEVLSTLGNHMGVPWTCLRPDDTFGGSLAVQPPDGEDLLEFEMFMEDWVEKRGLACPKPYVMKALGSVLEDLDRLLDGASVAVPRTEAS